MSSERRPTVVFYVSSHGWGHAVRAAEVARALVARGARAVLRSDAPAEAFAPLPDGAVLERAEVDVGVVQATSLAVDEGATLERFAGFCARWPELAEREASRLRELAADLVVADIAPLGVLAAGSAALPAVVLANFTWDWVYRSWADRYLCAAPLAERCAGAYRQATVLLATPFQGGLDSFPRREDVPLVVRTARRPREDVRADLGLAAGEVGVFVAFGGLGPPALAPPRDVEPHARFFGYADLGWPPELYRRVERGRHAHPDLVRAADVVLGKPGYGTVAECAHHGTPMLWVPRQRFPEGPVLEAAIADHVGGAEVDLAALREGRLRRALERALGRPARVGPLRGDGAAVVAERLFALAEGGRCRSVRPA